VNRLDEAVALNEASYRFDGIERIEADGTVVFTDATSGCPARSWGMMARGSRRRRPRRAVVADG